MHEQSESISSEDRNAIATAALLSDAGALGAAVVVWAIGQPKLPPYRGD